MVVYQLNVRGVVQGVGFRPFVYRLAKSMKLRGYVKNLGDAGVRIVIGGKDTDIDGFVYRLKKEGPPICNVRDIEIEEVDESLPMDFVILKSDTERGGDSSLIPPDLGICDNCRRELLDPNNRRYLHFFITCTNCGPRFTTIYSLPYDRERTSMKDFEMCRDCKEEYRNPMDRRFHAQTIACNGCGPNIFLSNGRETIFEGLEAIDRASMMLEDGKIIAVKGYGGFHIACSAEDDDVVLKLRRSLGREQQPFAVMVRDIRTANIFTELNEREKEILDSYIKPIVVVKKKGKLLSDYISPGLNTLGIMLPYSALHILLFRKNKLNAIVMTSANRPGYPMITDENISFNELKGVVDYYLFHNRKIVQRCDDSVVGFIGGTETKFRRSRGFVPLPVNVDYDGIQTVFSTGGETDVTFCILEKGRAFLSQHIGDISKYETMEFFKESLEHFINLFGFEIDAVATDLHPAFLTTIFAKEYSRSRDIPLIKIQHHHAHLASLLAECRLDNMVCITADGFGYGLDGKAWGGEILYGDFKDFKRVGHLEEQPMIGGDLSTIYPLRMAAGVLNGNKDLYEFLISRKERFPYGDREIDLIFRQLEIGRYQMTTSCGRILDASAAILDICHKRTYEGEPARKLESLATGGKYILDMEPEIEGDVIKTSPLLHYIFEYRDKFSKKDLAYSVEEYLARGFANIALKAAEENGTRYIGFSGGCAYNDHMVKKIKEIVEREGFVFLQHREVPPGDGGISLGQAMVAAARLE